MWVLVLQKITLSFFLDLLFFPIWWYSKGAVRALLFCMHLIQTGNRELAPGLWLRNIFVPMFGQRDIQGRLVSIFIRIINVIGRGIGLIFWIVMVFVLFLCWLILPLFVIGMLARSFA